MSTAARLASFTIGSGARATVLVHGFLGSGKNLRTLAQRWSEAAPDRTFLLPDLPGHGESPPLPPGADLDALAAAVLESASDLPGPLTIVGHSLGGRVALAAARRAPDRLSDVVLLDISPGPVEPSAHGETRRVLAALLAAPDEAGDRRELRAFFLGQGLSPGLTDWLLMNLRADGGGRLRWRIDRGALAALHDGSMTEDLWPVVDGAAVPVRCIRGGRSRYVTDAAAHQLAAMGCRVDTLAEAGHYVHVDALDALVALLR